MQSIAIPAVTQVRANGNYQPNNNQWLIGDSSILTHCIGLAPSKDVSLFFSPYFSVIAQLSNYCISGFHRIFERPQISQIVTCIKVERLSHILRLRHMQLLSVVGRLVQVIRLVQQM